MKGAPNRSRNGPRKKHGTNFALRTIFRIFVVTTYIKRYDTGRENRHRGENR